MDEDFEIELLDEDGEELPDQEVEIELSEEETTSAPLQLPLNFLSLGEIENDDVKVYIHQSVYKALEEYALMDTDHERGTILVGEYSEENGKIHVVISDYIEAKYAEATASTLTFTHETWGYVNEQMSEKHSDKKIVGWQHTHPGYGIFLSNYDLFIHENFFNLPFQIAYVIDPIQNLRGFFQWKENKIMKLHGYYVYDEVGTTIRMKKTKAEPKAELKEEPEKAPSETSGSTSNKKINALLVALCLVSVALAVLSTILAERCLKQGKLCDELQSELKSYEETVEDQAARMDRMESDIASGFSEKEDVPADSGKTDGTESKKDEVKLTSYTVKEGDTLVDICREHGIDYYASKGAILSMNGLNDAGNIAVGQVLYLPIEKD